MNPEGELHRSPKTIFDDETFQDELVTHICRCQKSLERIGHLLETKDFAPVPGHRHGQHRWLIAQLALEYWQQHHRPIRRMLTSSVIEHCRVANTAERVQADILEYARTILKRKLRYLDDIVAKVQRFKQEKRMARGLSEMVEEHSAGRLDEERWRQLTEEVFRPSNTDHAEILTADKLMTTVFEQPHYAVNHLVPMGFSILAGVYKIQRTKGAKYRDSSGLPRAGVYVLTEGAQRGSGE